MTLKEKIQKDLNESLKSGERTKRLVLGMVITSIKNSEINKRTKLSKSLTDTRELERQSLLTDEEIIEAIVSEVKKRREAIEQYSQAGRADLANKEQEELNILTAYLPAQMSEAEVKQAVEKAVSETGAKDIKDMGKVMGVLMPKVKGRADGSLISRLVKECLAK